LNAPLRPRVPAAGPASMLRPQRLLDDAAREASRRVAPSGLGLDSAAVRERMVQRLRAAGVADAAVLDALGRVPRHAFVDTALATQAYEDTALPIGLSQTISKPSVVAQMLALARGGANARAQGHLGRVLEIGTGCGYQAALLALLATRVVTIERLKPLHDKARANLASIGVRAPRLVFGDGMRGHAASAPYDTVIAAAGGDALPPAWLEQLADGGRLVAPVHDPARGGQVLAIVDRHGAEWRRSLQQAVHFVPLRSGVE
jgi:protein-L-isoaspartate(D-aspartate) O-methyltransferase